MNSATRLCALPIPVVMLVPLLVACGGSGEVGPTAAGSSSIPVPKVGTIVVALRPLGNGRDSDGFTTTIDGTTTRTLSADAPVRYEGLKPGDHTVQLEGVAPHCRAGADSAVLPVKAGMTDTLQIEVTCLGGIAYHEVISQTQFDISYLDEQGRTIKLAGGPGKKFIQEWSPDGTRILYAKLEQGDYPSHLYSVRVDGTDTRQLTSGSGTESRARWSPDGTHIVLMQQGRVDGDSASGGPTIGLLRGSYIVVIGADGSDRRILIDSRAFDIDPVWSADGARLYFGCTRLGRVTDLCSTSPDGSGLRAIRYATLDALVPPCSSVCAVSPSQFEASPDGRRILFQMVPAQNVGPQGIWGATLDGTSAVSLSGSVTSYVGTWSQSGDRVLLGVANENLGLALATVKPDGTDYHLIGNFGDHDESGHFSPDAAVVAFDGFQTGTQRLWVMNADGSARRTITSGTVQAFYPFFNPKAHPTGRLTGGEPSRASLQSTPSRSLMPQTVDSDASTPASYCRAMRVGATTRVVCPSNR